AAMKWRPASPPQASANTLSVYDSAIRRVLMYDGNTAESWAFNGRGWSWGAWKGPSPRTGASMVYDAASKKVVLFGGYGQVSAFGSQYLADTWTFDGKRWTKLQGDGPPPREYASMVYDAAARKVVLFSGYGCVPKPDS